MWSFSLAFGQSKPSPSSCSRACPCKLPRKCAIQVVLNLGLGIKTSQHFFFELQSRFIGRMKKTQGVFVQQIPCKTQNASQQNVFKIRFLCVFSASLCCQCVFYSQLCETNITCPFNSLNMCKALHAPSASNTLFHLNNLCMASGISAWQCFALPIQMLPCNNNRLDAEQFKATDNSNCWPCRVTAQTNSWRSTVPSSRV